MLPDAATPPQQASLSGWNSQPLWDLRCALGVSCSKPCCRDSKAQVEFQQFGIPAESSRFVVLGPFSSTLDPQHPSFSWTPSPTLYCEISTQKFLPNEQLVHGAPRMGNGTWQ